MPLETLGTCSQSNRHSEQRSQSQRDRSEVILALPRCLRGLAEADSSLSTGSCRSPTGPGEPSTQRPITDHSEILARDGGSLWYSTLITCQKRSGKFNSSPGRFLNFRREACFDTAFHGSLPEIPCRCTPILQLAAGREKSKLQLDLNAYVVAYSATLRNFTCFYVVLNSAVRQHQGRLRTTADERKTCTEKA